MGSNEIELKMTEILQNDGKCIDNSDILTVFNFLFNFTFKKLLNNSEELRNIYE